MIFRQGVGACWLSISRLSHRVQSLAHIKCRQTPVENCVEDFSLKSCVRKFFAIDSAKGQFTPLTSPGRSRMAEASQRPGAFVLEVAELGKEVLSSFTKFVLSRKVLNRRLETLLANISITTSLLVDLGSTIKKYEYDYHVKDSLTRPVCETCKANFEQLIVLSNIAKEKGGWITEGAVGGKAVATEVDTFFIFDISLGIGEKSTQFWSRLDEIRSTIASLNDLIKYKIFKQLDQQ